MTATSKPGEIDRRGDDWGIVIPLERHLRRFCEGSPQDPQDGEHQEVTLDLVRRVLALPESQRRRLMAFLHLAADPGAVESSLDLPRPGIVELRLAAPTHADA